MAKFDVRQIARFGLIGGAATAVHMLIGLVLIRTGWPAGWANAAAFAVAFVASFVGHLCFSFADHQAKTSTALWRFGIVALTGFACNHAVLLGLIASSLVSDELALAISTSCAALVTFSLSRSWAFAARRTRSRLCIQHSKDPITCLISLRRG